MLYIFPSAFPSEAHGPENCTKEPLCWSAYLCPFQGCHFSMYPMFPLSGWGWLLLELGPTDCLTSSAPSWAQSHPSSVPSLPRLGSNPLSSPIYSYKELRTVPCLIFLPKQAPLISITLSHHPSFPIHSACWTHKTISRSPPPQPPQIRL